MLLEVVMGLLGGLVRSFGLWLAMLIAGFGVLYLLLEGLTTMW